MLSHWRPPTSANIRQVSRVMSFLLGFFLAAAAGGTADTQKPTYKFGVFPYLPAVQLEGIYAPIGADFSRALASDVQFRTSSTFATFAENLRQQAYDIAFGRVPVRCG